MIRSDRVAERASAASNMLGILAFLDAVASTRGGDTLGGPLDPRAPASDPPRLAQPAREGEPRARLPAALGPLQRARPAAPPALGARWRERVDAGQRVLMSLHFLTPGGRADRPRRARAARARRGGRAAERADARIARAPRAPPDSRFGLPVAVALLATVARRSPPPSPSSARTAAASFEPTPSCSLPSTRRGRWPPRRTRRRRTRLDRARAIGYRLRAALPDVPMGLGTFTDRPLPILLPTTDARGVHRGRPRLARDRGPAGARDQHDDLELRRRRALPARGVLRPEDQEAPARDRHRRREHELQRGGRARQLQGTAPYGGRPDPDGHARRARLRLDGAPRVGLHPAARDRGHAQAVPRRRRAARRSARGTTRPARSPPLARRSAPAPQARIGTTSDRRELAPWLVLAGVFPLGFVLRRRNFSAQHNHSFQRSITLPSDVAHPLSGRFFSHVGSSRGSGRFGGTAKPDRRARGAARPERGRSSPR